MEEIKLYTIKDLRDWVIEDKCADGLSEAIIPKTRAYSYINNPYVTADMAAVSAIFVDGELAAFTTSFPEQHAKPKALYHFINSLYVKPKFEGRGYGIIVVGALLETFDESNIYDLDPVDTSVKILEYFGLEHSTFTEYTFRQKYTNSASLLGKVAYCKNKIQDNRRQKVTQNFLKNRACVKYSLRYDNIIDGEAYDFIIKHCENDVFLRTQESLNWALRYPFLHEAPLIDKVEKVNLFWSSILSHNYWVVKVYVDGVLVGLYIIGNSDKRFALRYLYYEQQYSEVVFANIIEHLMKLCPFSISTTNKDFADFLDQSALFPINTKQEKHFCHQESLLIENLNIQLGDGDMFMC